MMDFELSEHARDMLKERKIADSWIQSTIENPDRRNLGEDGNMHYFKTIPEYGSRVLHLVVNPDVVPMRIVTVFFDRRAQR
ncbi:MAG: DUF4258 domain-containing protein [Chloroflexi bacterium]|nr:DUF4258 domain-containing protein [Chloroflexota bacterium]